MIKNRMGAAAILLLMWIPTLLFSVIIETNNIEDLEKYIDAETSAIPASHFFRVS